jgi:hypothetical protein
MAFSRQARVALGLSLLTALSCGAPQEPANPALGLPAYSPEEARLFDDVITPELFNYGLSPRQAESDPLMDDRAAMADTATIMKVTTLSREGSGTAYSVSLRPVATISGPAERQPVTLSVSAASPSFLLLEGLGARWVGTELVLLARRYRHGEEAVIHFRAEPNRPAVVGVIARARGAK